MSLHAALPIWQALRVRYQRQPAHVEPALEQPIGDRSRPPGAIALPRDDQRPMLRVMLDQPRADELGDGGDIADDAGEGGKRVGTYGPRKAGADGIDEDEIAVGQDRKSTRLNSSH